MLLTPTPDPPTHFFFKQEAEVMEKLNTIPVFGITDNEGNSVAVKTPDGATVNWVFLQKDVAAQLVEAFEQQGKLQDPLGEGVGALQVSDVPLGMLWKALAKPGEGNVTTDGQAVGKDGEAVAVQLRLMADPADLQVARNMSARMELEPAAAAAAAAAGNDTAAAKHAAKVCHGASWGFVGLSETVASKGSPRPLWRGVAGEAIGRRVGRGARVHHGRHENPSEKRHERRARRTPAVVFEHCELRRVLQKGVGGRGGRRCGGRAGRAGRRVAPHGHAGRAGETHAGGVAGGLPQRHLHAFGVGRFSLVDTPRVSKGAFPAVIFGSKQTRVKTQNALCFMQKESVSACEFCIQENIHI
jgi:hypothetical protein